MGAQFEVVIARDAEQVSDAGLLEAAKQEVADFHSSAGAAGHRFCLLQLIISHPSGSSPECRMARGRTRRQRPLLFGVLVLLAVRCGRAG
jgi:hypothetical protein